MPCLMTFTGLKLECPASVFIPNWRYVVKELRHYLFINSPPLGEVGRGFGEVGRGLHYDTPPRAPSPSAFYQNRYIWHKKQENICSVAILLLLLQRSVE